MALFDTGAKELALSTYDSGSTTDTAVDAYRKARTGGAALMLGPLFGTSATALAPLVAQSGANVVSFSNDEAAATRGVWVMGIAAPPQVRRVVDHAIDAGIKRFATFAPQTPYGEQMARTLESHVAVRGGAVVAAELYDPNSADLMTPARRLASEIKGEGKLAVLVPVAPHRLATLAYDGVALAGHLARLKPGGDFSAEALTNPNGWSGIDGIFRLLPDGRTDRALAVIEVQAARNTVVSPAPATFAPGPVN